MRRMHPTLLPAMMLAALIHGGSALALQVDFSIQPRVLQLGEAAVARVTIRDADNPPQPALPGAQGLRIHPSGTERSFSFGSGGRDSSVTYTYQVIPDGTGAFVIGPWTYEHGGERVELPALQIEVVAPGSGQQKGAQSERIEDYVFARILADRSEVFAQESFELVLALYYRDVNLDRDIALVDMKTTGLNLSGFQEIQGAREVVDGRVFEVRRFRTMATALTAGQFELAPVLRVSVLVPRQRRDPFEAFGFGDFFGSRFEARPLDLQAKSLSVNVKDLPPDGRPPSFAGAVGRFAFDVMVTPTEARAGDPLTVRSRIRGRGNLDVLSAPTLALDDRFRVYDPKLVSRSFDENTRTGEIVFEQVVIPRTHEIKELPAVTFSYFNPEDARYESIVQGPLAVLVKEGDPGQARFVQGRADAQPGPAKVLGTDIVYLKPSPGADTRWPPAILPVSAAARGLQALPPVALALLWLLLRRREDLERDEAKARRLAAPRVARKALRKAEAAADEGDSRAFTDALWESLVLYFGHRFNLRPGDIERDAVCDRAKRAGLREEDAAFLRDVFNQCEEARFAPRNAEPGRVARDRVRRLAEIFNACERLRS